MVSTPEVSGDLLFIGSCAGVFYALDKNTGGVRWSYDAGKDQRKVGFHGNPIILDDLIVIGTDINEAPRGAGYVYAFERASGKLRWRVAAGRGVASDIVRAGSSLYGVTLSDELVSIDPATGSVSWAFSSRSGRGDRIPSAPVTAGGRVFYGDRDGGLYALDSKTGRVDWKREFTTPVSTSLAVFGESVFLGAANHIYRISQKTGAIEAHYLADGWSSARPVISGNSLLVFIGNTVASIDLSLNKINWRQKTSSRWTTPRPLIVGDVILAGTEIGEVVAFRITDGSHRWSHKFSGTIRSIANSGRVLYIGTREGTVYAYRAPDLGDKAPDGAAAAKSGAGL
ncbi:MAG TPA: PQQ-binding-like beta-propeller repeat protein [Blastocatellia bacterium]|nr:PQQ-binding-like beta-propeller repeat protein [Blastocatellia bacterium]